MILSVHIADVGARRELGILRTQPTVKDTPGLLYGQTTIVAPLSPSLLPSPRLGRVALIAAWRQESALESFIEHGALGERLAGGWHVRLQPTRVFGAWSALPGLPQREEPMDEREPAVALTLGRLRVSQTLRFLRASAKAEQLALSDPALIASTGLARPPGMVATFSIWQSTGAMRSYVLGRSGPGHREATRAHAARAFHHESAFIRLRPLSAYGSWEGREPLALARGVGSGVPSGERPSTSREARTAA